MAYDKNKDYQAEIDKAVKNGDYASASRLETERNEKIDAEGLAYEKTNNYQKPNGVTDATFNKMNSTFSKPDVVDSWDSKTNDAYSNFYQEASKGDIISQNVKNNLNKGFRVPSAVTEADAFLSSQLQKIQSSKASYTDDVKNMMDKILNREKFSYDVDSDPLFQQALASAMNSGKQVMQDTIGQASALTGGYGSTYATTAGNQAYNSFIEDAYDNLPQYYQMAMEAYQMEGDEMYRQLGMLTDADETEYNRNVAAYDATYQHRNQMYNEAYGQYRDSKSDAFNMANLQLNEHSQKVSDAYNLYNATSTQADKLYEREYNSWLDSINIAFQNAQMQNSDWWNQTNFNEGVRQYEKNYAQAEDHFTRNQEFQATESQKQRDWESSENQLNRDWESSENQLNRDWESSENQKDRDFTASENAKNRSSKGGSGGGDAGGSPKVSTYKFTSSEINGIIAAAKAAGSGEKAFTAAVNYAAGLGKAATNDEQRDVIYNLISDVINEKEEKKSFWSALFD